MIRLSTKLFLQNFIFQNVGKRNILFVGFFVEKELYEF